MFDVEYKGGNAVVITTKKVQLVFDPAVSLIGGKDVSINEAIELLTSERFIGKNGKPKLAISSPGEYGIADVSITGVAARRNIDSEDQKMTDTMYRVVIGDVRIAVIGNVDPKLSDEQLEMLGVVDMLILPIGGNGYTIDPADAATLARQIEPRAVVPVHYDDPSLKYEVPQQGIDVFIKELNGNVVESGPKLKVKSLAALPDQLTVMHITKS